MGKGDYIIKQLKEKFDLKKNSEHGLYSLVFPKDKITKLEDGLFSDTTEIKNKALQEVYIPDTIQSIGNKCFINCSNLEKISISDSVTNIGDSCFRNCKKLKKVKLPSNIQVLQKFLFSWCNNLSTLNIPEGVTTIEDGCFMNCTNLEKIDLPTTVSKIGEYVFSQCTSLKRFSFNDNIESVSSELFSDCQNLEEVILPLRLNMIGKRAFSGCYNLRNIKLPDKLTTIEEEAFRECESLTDIIIPSSVTQIGAEAFSDCSNLENITIKPKTSKLKDKLVIQDEAFNGCCNVKSLNLPNGALDNLQAFDFSNMPKLKSVTYDNKNILNLSQSETFSDLLYNGKLFYIEYINQSGETVSKVLEDINSQKRDIRSIDITRQFNMLCNHKIFQENFSVDTNNSILCLNMLSVLNYETCAKLLNLLEQKKINNEAMVEVGTKKSLFTKIREFIFKHNHKKKNNQNTEEHYIQNVSAVEVLETLFSSPKILNQENTNNYIKFFNDNINEIINLTDIEELENLAKVQKSFQVLVRNPMMKRKIQMGKLTLQEVLQNKNLYGYDNNDEEFYDITVKSGEIGNSEIIKNNSQKENIDFQK